MIREIQHTAEKGETIFHRKFLWYIDIGCGEPSRRSAYQTIGALLMRPPRSVEQWVKHRRPNDWRLILELLEREYGPAPEELTKGM